MRKPRDWPAELRIVKDKTGGADYVIMHGAVCVAIVYAIGSRWTWVGKDGSLLGDREQCEYYHCQAALQSLATTWAARKARATAEHKAKLGEYAPRLAGALRAIVLAWPTTVEEGKARFVGRELLAEMARDGLIEPLGAPR